MSDSTSLERRVAALEVRVTTLESNFKNLADRVYALEIANTTPPPTQPPSEGDETLQELVDAGGHVSLTKDEYNEYCTVNKPVVIIGKPTTIDVTGMNIANGKGIFDAQKDIELSDTILKGAIVPDGNGAGIRGAIGANVTMYDCEVTGCQMGILVSGGGADINITSCNFHDCGAADGQSHEIYCSAVNKDQYGETEFNITDSDVRCGVNSCHALKVRATRINVTGCTLIGTPGTDPGSAGSVVDLPDGGEVVIEDTDIEMMASSPTSTIFGYMTENTSQGAGTVTLRRVKIIDGRNRGGDLWCRSGVGGKLVLEECTYTADKPPNLVGWDSVTGKFTKEA